MKKHTLLFVEDDQETIEYVHELLSPYFDKIHVGYNGSSGLDAFHRFKPDIVLTDINMPVMNGIEMVQEIRRTNPDVPVIFFTSSSDNNLLLEAINLGVDGFVVKPIINVSSLLSPVEKVVRTLNEQAESERLHHIIELQSRQASLGEILANISHQWRQPLNNICLGIQDIFSTLRQHGSDGIIDSQVKEMLYDQINSMSSMLDDVRKLFHNDHETAVDIKLSDIFSKIESFYSSSFIFNQVKYKLSLPEDITLNVNQQNIIHSFINIINNAKYAMLNNTLPEDRYLFINASVKDGNAVITFRDSGGGIDEKLLHSVFDPYITSKHQNVGVGVGLYMTFQIVVYQHKGSIEARNTEYEHDGRKLKGAQITVRLPLSG